MDMYTPASNRLTEAERNATSTDLVMTLALRALRGFQDYDRPLADRQAEQAEAIAGIRAWISERGLSPSPPPAKPQHTNTYGCRCGCTYMPDAPVQPDARIEKKTVHDAPLDYSYDRAIAWAEGYNQALREYAEALKGEQG